MIKIAHISDIHIRNLKYHDEYRSAFHHLYSRLRELEPDLIINTGDTAHTKVQISPEFVQMASDFIRNLGDIAEHHIILGNHDLNLMNPDRQDAITPIVKNLNHPNVFLHKKSEMFSFAGKMNFFVYSLADEEGYWEESDISRYPETINVGLFHGSVRGCVTDIGWKMQSTEQDLTLFRGLDYVLMGDIHKRQFLGERVAYAGSLIQQNFGEDPEKGFLLWEIEDKRKHQVSFHQVFGSRQFHTVRLLEDLSIPEMKIPQDSRLRIVSPKVLSYNEMKSIEKSIKEKFRPKDVISFTTPNDVVKKSFVSSKSDVENIRSLDVQEKLIRKFFNGRNVAESVLSRIIEMNKRYQIHIEQQEEVARNVLWKVNKIGWSGMFNYGSDNFIDFSTMPGLFGIFAPNASGKSSITDILLESLYDKIAKDAPRNVELVNDNKDEATMVVDLSIGDQDYVISRKIERIRRPDGKEWGKTSLDFSTGDVSLNGVSRPDTEREIRKRIGTFEDFCLTSMVAQHPISGIPGGADLINCKETDRKKILFRFLDLDIFEQKCSLAKEECKLLFEELRKLNDSNIFDDLKEKTKRKRENALSMKELECRITQMSSDLESIEQELDVLHSKRVKVEEFRGSNLVRRDLSSIRCRLLALGQVRKEQKFLVVDLDSSISSIKEEMSRFDLKQISLAQNELSSVGKEIERTKGAISVIEKTREFEGSKVSTLAVVPCGDQFPTCQFLSDAFKARKKLPKLDAELEELKEKLSRLDDSRKKLVAAASQATKLDSLSKKLQKQELAAMSAKVELEKSTAGVKELLTKVSGLKSELQKSLAMEEASGENDEVNKMISELQTRRHRITGELKVARPQLDSLNRSFGAICRDEEQVRKLAERAEFLKEECEAFELFIEAMGKHGIAYHVLAEKLPTINDEINKILSNASVKFCVSLEHDQEEQTIRLYLQYGDYRRRNIGLGSGAEKLISSLALRAALVNVSNLPKTNVFIVDEGFGKLDPNHFESVQKMFDYLKSVFDHVIVISHTEWMRDIVDGNLEILIDSEGYAHVESV